MIGELENDRCYFCGGRLTSDLATMPFVVGSSIVIIKQVPAQVCAQCGEAIVDSPVAEVVDHLLRQARHSGFEVSILTYSQPELAIA